MARHQATITCCALRVSEVMLCCVQLVIGGRNKYLINGVAAQPSRVQNMFHSVQLNVNNPHFLIMQGRITKVLSHLRRCPPPLPATRCIQGSVAAGWLVGWASQYSRQQGAAATTRGDRRTRKNCPVLSRSCRRSRPCSPRDALVENNVLLQSHHRGEGVHSRPALPH